MEDVPQPSRDQYSVGDQVQVYVGPTDLDSQYHGLVCEVVDVRIDNFNSETGRTNDAYLYTLKDAKTGEKLPISFRHQDLVPAENAH